MTSLTPEIMAALAVFALVSSLTPGPNNAMLLASGANFGLARSAPHVLGVSIGFLVLMLGVGFGLGGLMAAFPIVHDVIKLIGGAYLLYLAFKIATATGVAGGQSGAKPQTFLQAAAFQWVNPKAWAMALGAVAAYAPADRYAANIVAISLIFALINLPCVLVWTGCGVALRRLLDRPRFLRALNWTMAALLVLSLYPLLTGWSH